MKPLAISMGCPGGIGPEVTLRALLEDAGEALVFGDVALLQARAATLGVDLGRLRARLVQVGPPLSVDARSAGRWTKEGGAAQLAYVDAALDAVLAGEASAIVTAPVSKAAVQAGGAAGFLGHTEHFGARLGSETVMAFWEPNLTLSLATTHLPLSAVAGALDSEQVARAAFHTARLLDALGVDGELDVAVLALNPHAGEEGLLGDEEGRVIAPGIVAARERLRAAGSSRRLVGPLPAESAIRRAARDHAHGACVAMYHDQATIPSKLLAFGEAVNVTLGMPVVRTSVDHGTAYDRAGQGTADPRGMAAAIGLARRLAR
ncbi:MAG: 4-hydroxythreonine-4-phosphate dehydrogenase PdxA [Myxococcales bacterium]|nr:4-hydroxythreonine-4-phosphate dehydrogenase PdxA [Myxococcales bacterium]